MVIDFQLQICALNEFHIIYTSNSKVTLILVAFIYVSENVKVSLGVSIEYSNQLVIQSNSYIFIKQCNSGKTNTFSYESSLMNTLIITGTSNLIDQYLLIGKEIVFIFIKTWIISTSVLIMENDV